MIIAAYAIHTVQWKLLQMNLNFLKCNLFKKKLEWKGTTHAIHK